MTWPLHHGLDVDAMDPRAKVVMHLVDGGRAVSDRLEALIEQRPTWFMACARAWVLAVYGIDMAGSPEQQVLDLIPRHVMGL